MCRLVFTLVILLFSTNQYAWNNLGHKLVAHIAYDQLTPQAKILYQEYNTALNTYSVSTNLINAAVWLDDIRQTDIHWFDVMHYINYSFSKDKTPLLPVNNINALWAIHQAVNVLTSTKSSQADKGMALRMLLHIVGDLHQPLHTATKVSARYPKGDMGGNLFFLAKNPQGKNLHQYWDNGGGFLQQANNPEQVQRIALALEEQWPCNLSLRKEEKPKQWALQAHQIALKQAYTIQPYKVPSKSYKLKTQKITQQQIALAGCRLGALLNRITE